MACEYSITGEQIGFGKDADIFLAERDKRKFALKIFKEPRAIYNPIEVDIQFKLKNEFLVRGEDILTPGICDINSPGLVSQHFPIRLKDQLPFMTYKDKKRIMIELAKGMRCLHNNKYLYLDCKLENCMLKKDRDSYKGVLIDFGLSSYAPKGIDKGLKTIQRRTNTFYTPPECIKEYDDGYYYNNKSDIWCLGIVFMRILTDNADYLPDYIVKDTTFPDFTGLAEFYLRNLTEDFVVNFMEKNVADKIRHDEVKGDDVKHAQERKNMLGLLMSMIRVNEKKRISISDVIGHPFFREENKIDECKKDIIKPISLQDVEFEYFAGIFTIIEYLRDHFDTQCIALFFMAVDIYLRNVYALTLKSEEFDEERADKLAKNCCLIAFKYYNWSELKNYSPDLSKKLYSKEFVIEETIIYKRLNGKIREERYFENAKNRKELELIYKRFIQPKRNPDENIYVSELDFSINANILNYLKEDGVEYIKKLDLREKENIWNIQIRDFFT